MKNLFLLFSFLLIITGCSSDDGLNYITVNGTVEREVNDEGVPNQKVQLEMKKVIGTGIGGPIHETIDTKIVTTDENGNFSASMIDDTETHIVALVLADENYSVYNLKIFEPNEHILLKVNKFIDFKIYVENTDPFDSNDFIQITFFTGVGQAYTIGIENFGAQNTQYPAQHLPGGGIIGAYEEASWEGTNVNSIVYYKVPENSDHFKIHWVMRKNGVETTGFTEEIPYVIDEVNEFHFNY